VGANLDHIFEPDGRLFANGNVSIGYPTALTDAVIYTLNCADAARGAADKIASRSFCVFYFIDVT
jgi:hypothetical protein